MTKLRFIAPILNAQSILIIGLLAIVATWWLYSRANQSDQSDGNQGPDLRSIPPAGAPPISDSWTTANQPVRESKREPITSDAANPAVREWTAGLALGWVAGFCWLTTAVRKKRYRWLLRMAMVIVLAGIQTKVAGPAGSENGLATHTDFFLRYASNLLGIAIVVALSFSILRVPQWNRRHRTHQSRPTKDDARHQFNVGDLLIGTTVLALLLAMMVRYHPAPGSLPYWLVMTVVWIVMPIMFALLAMALLSTKAMYSALLLGLAGVIAAASSYGLALAEKGLVELSTSDAASLSSLALRYGMIHAIAASCFAVYAIAGRISGHRECNHQMSDPGPSLTTSDP